jgi:ABC-type dipeptide/oligopeptide/nickel transport system permease component
MLAARIARHLLSLAAIVLLGAFLSAALVRAAPGFDVDEQQLDPRLNASSISALRDSHRQEHSLFRFYLSYLGHSLRGDLGVSRSLGQPVRGLLRDRVPVTIRIVLTGLALGWLFAVALGLTAALARTTAYDRATLIASGIFLCLPAAALALLSVLLNSPGYLGIALIVFPKVFRYMRNLLAKAYALPHICTARAKGLSELRILGFHVLPVIAPELLALAGVSISVAVGAAIPIETLCGIAGVGQLAWQAALGRDLPLLVNITVLVTLVTLSANFGADVISHILKSEGA